MLVVYGSLGDSGVIVFTCYLEKIEERLICCLQVSAFIGTEEFWFSELIVYFLEKILSGAGSVVFYGCQNTAGVGDDNILSFLLGCNSFNGLIDDPQLFSVD
ncbi:hypothetical protein CHS0354_034698 [Potamilus streckersoni]|uniref:Uncharacterized protein n=1 Tax=Potamilus streckersoni TaxID=2493646 RepID=A0AAE0TJ31_9BIVA|nr:hypothetical protein CHS0354_034698 [Potamilus streckersoni]